MLFFLDVADHEVQLKDMPTILNKISGRVQQLVNDGNKEEYICEEITDVDGKRIGEFEVYQYEDANNENARRGQKYIHKITEEVRRLRESIKHKK